MTDSSDIQTTNTLADIIGSCPYTTDFSKFEQENFLSPSSAGYPRFIIGLINRYRKIDSDLEKESRTFERNCLLEEKSKITLFLSTQDVTKVENAIKNWEDVEPEYWADTLGKIAAIEILTYGKTTYDTMMKMVKLPENLYIKSTQLCVKLANKVKETTVAAEEQIGLTADTPTVTVTPSQPKKLFLKKTK